MACAGLSTSIMVYESTSGFLEFGSENTSYKENPDMKSVRKNSLLQGD